MEIKITKQFGVYSITHIESRKQYVGSTSSSFSHRWYEHRRDLNKNKHCNKHLQRAWNKYGEESFSFEILEVIDIKEKEVILKAEQYLIDTLKPEYNMNPKAGSRLGSTQTEESKQKCREFWTGRKRGPMSAEHKEKNRLGHIGKSSPKKGKPVSESQKQKQSEYMKGRYIGESNPYFGRTHSEEVRLKMSNAAKLREANKKVQK